MRPTRTLSIARLGSLSLASLAAGALGCGSIPVDATSSSPTSAEIAPSGVLRGSVVYDGPPPCSADGHVVGAAILFVFDRRNLPPPAGTASTPVNFGVVTGDTLFASLPRNGAASTDCPAGGSITASAPFTISPVPGGSYVIQAFYDYTGDFLPTFKFRDLPEKGDVAGGAIDTADAVLPMNAGNPNYQPRFLPVDVGVAQPLPAGAPDGGIPNFVVPSSGFVADDLTVTLGETLPTPRPYSYAGGLQVNFDPTQETLTTTEVQTSSKPATPGDTTGIAGTVETSPDYEPILTIPQDISILAPPVQNMDPEGVGNFESKLPHLILHGGLPSAEAAAAIAVPFDFQLPPTGAGGFLVWQSALYDPGSASWVPQEIPEGNGIPQLWPLVVLTKLVDDPGHVADPASITTQGGPGAPVVILQGITLLEGTGTDPTQPDSLFNTGLAQEFGSLFDPSTGQPTIFQQDHLTVALRPAVICFDQLFDPAAVDTRGTLVTPSLSAPTADLTNPMMNAPIVPPSALASPQLAGLVTPTPMQACLPTGRYAINVVYPDGQAWTVPNESGACTQAEGATDTKNLTCTLQPRPILYSQGTRAVVEITASPAHCGGAMSVPPVCSVQTPQ